MPDAEKDSLGPPSDFGWRRCHGCDGVGDGWESPLVHEPDCPGRCARPNCDWHVLPPAKPEVTS